MEQIDTLITDPVIALCTPDSSGALALIRISGTGVIEMTAKAWSGPDITAAKPRTAIHGRIIGSDGSTIDDVIAIPFHAPASFTGQDTVEITCHGSRWIVREIIHRFIGLGCKPAPPGEFSRRAFANGKILLSEAEGIADLIASSSRAAHDIALTHIDGTYSRRLTSMRADLLNLLSLIDLTLDFSQEDITFADTDTIRRTAADICAQCRNMAESFHLGAALRDGVPVVIAGPPNAGKSTLLNTLLGTDKAIVTDIPGTTRDTLDGTVEIQGILFRFIDTAGIHPTTDTVERIGIDRAKAALSRAKAILWVIDPAVPLQPQTAAMREATAEIQPNTSIIPVVNKTDTASTDTLTGILSQVPDAIPISARYSEGIPTLTERLVADFTPGAEQSVIITSERHYAALSAAADALDRAGEDLDADIPADLIAQHIRAAATSLGDITGAITPDEELRHIFRSFCIGK